jgi:hypothetical protein
MKKPGTAYQALCIAEGEGFEPPVPERTTVFKTAAIDHSANPLFNEIAPAVNGSTGMQK